MPSFQSLSMPKELVMRSYSACARARMQPRTGKLAAWGWSAARPLGTPQHGTLTRSMALRGQIHVNVHFTAKSLVSQWCVAHQQTRRRWCAECWCRLEYCCGCPHRITLL